MDDKEKEYEDLKGRAEKLRRDLERSRELMARTVGRIVSFALGVLVASPVVAMSSRDDIFISVVVSSMAIGFVIASIHYFADLFGSRN